MSEQQVISFDATILNEIQLCARRAKLGHIDRIGTVETAEALERGDLLHKCLELYYSGIASVSLDSETWRQLPILPEDTSDRVQLIRFITGTAAPFFAAKMTLPIDEVEETIFQFHEYTKFYENDGWRPLVVEEVGSKLLYEDESLKVIYNFKIDLIAEKGNLVIPFDHKSSKRRTTTLDLSNQFMGYAWGLGMQHVIVNKIGFQKTLKPVERFTRETMTYGRPRLEEWRLNTIFWAKQYAQYMKDGYFPMNFTSCDKYSGCPLRRICESDESGREWIIERDFKIKEPWDVAKILEAK